MRVRAAMMPATSFEDFRITVSVKSHAKFDPWTRPLCRKSRGTERCEKWKPRSRDRYGGRPAGLAHGDERPRPAGQDPDRARYGNGPNQRHPGPRQFSKGSWTRRGGRQRQAYALAERLIGGDQPLRRASLARGRIRAGLTIGRRRKAGAISHAGHSRCVRAPGSPRRWHRDARSHR